MGGCSAGDIVCRNIPGIGGGVSNVHCQKNMGLTPGHLALRRKEFVATPWSIYSCEMRNFQLFFMWINLFL